MIHLTAWIAPDILRALGLSLLHFLWQGAALAALAAAAMAFARRASARYVVAVAVLAIMATAPIVTFNILRNQPAAIVADSPAQPNDSAPTTAHPALGFVPGQSPRTPSNNQDAILWLVQVWFIGVLLFSLRTAGGVVLLERIRRRDAIPADDSLAALGAAIQRRMGLNRIIRYCESLELEAPAVIGWFRPVVLLPISALTGFSQEQLQAVIAHELAHIKRFDGFVNLFQVVVESLLFYHPAVWWLNRRIRAERENCCDDAAIALCGNPLEYARALTLMEERRAAPALAMAANSSPLAARIRRLLGAPSLNSGLRTLGLAAAILCLSAAVLAGNAFFATAHSAAAQTKPASPAWPATNPVIVVEAARPTTTAAPKPQVAPAVEADPAVAASPAPEPAQAPASEPQPQSQASPAPKQSYIDGMKAEGLDNLSLDELISMKVQGITAQYVHDIHALGLKPSVDDLVGMKVQGITPDYVKEMRAAGLNLDVDQLIAMKVQSITPVYMQAMKDLGLKTDADDLIGMKVQGITPDYVKEMRGLGLNADGDNLIGMKVQGITPEYVQQMRATGLKIDTDDLIGMKVQGITPAYIKELGDLGFKVDADSAIGMKVQGITPEYIRDIRATGLNPDGDEIIGMKVQGITPEYIKSLQSAGFKVDVDDCIGAKVQGVTPEFIEKARSHGFKDLTLEKLIALKNSGVLD